MKDNVITIDARWVDVSGIGVYLRNIIPFILNYFSESIIYLIGSYDLLIKIKDFNKPNVKIINYYNNMYSLSSQFRLLFLIPKNTNLYFATHYNFPVFYNGKIIVMVYDLYHVSKLNRKNKLQNFYASFFFKLIKIKKCKILTISNFTKNELINKYQIHANKIYVTYLSNNKFYYNELSELNKSKYNYDYILFVGNIKPHKNLKLLISAFNKLRSNIPHKLLLVGKKDGFITADSTSVTFSVDDDRIIFSGYVDDDELSYLYKNASVFVFPSLYEGFGIPPLEAMYFNCPVLSSSAASLTEVCGDAAIYFDPFSLSDLSDKLLLILNDDKLKEEMIKRGKLNLVRFSWEKCGTETVEIFNNYIIYD